MFYLDFPNNILLFFFFYCTIYAYFAYNDVYLCIQLNLFYYNYKKKKNLYYILVCQNFSTYEYIVHKREPAPPTVKRNENKKITPNFDCHFDILQQIKSKKVTKLLILLHLLLLLSNNDRIKPVKMDFPETGKKIIFLDRFPS